jgi:predicted lipid-binding transport protein (Tim44 family)
MPRRREMADTQLLTILLIASVAGFFLFRLYSVLGRRTGHERPPQEDYRLAPRPADETVGAIPKLGPQPVYAAPDRPADPVAAGLFDISLSDRSFDKDQFLKGAQAAYEMILTAFAAGDRETLKPLLSDEVFAAFDGVIKSRETHKQKATLTLVGFSDVKTIAAALKASVAEITLAFASRLISATTDADGKVVEGDATAVQDVTDVWTFARDVRARDPNWVLVATSGEPL